MNDFLDHNIQFVLEWGQLLMALLVVAACLLIYLIERRHTFFLPKRVFAFFGNLFLMAVIVLSTFGFLTISGMKTQGMAIINGLEHIKGKKAPNLSFKLVENDTVKTIDDYKGDIVLVNYWATWCPGCIKELPDLMKLQEEYKDKGLKVIALSDEDKEKLLKFNQERKIHLISGYVKEFQWVEVGQARPITFLINREGIIADYFIGSYDYNFFKTRISDYLHH